MTLKTDKKPRNSLVGQRFGRLEVLAVAGYTAPPCGRYEWYYECKCECGKEKRTSAQNLRSGDAKSCGCLQVEHGKNVNLRHGMSFQPTYNSWAAMKERTRNKNHHAFGNYGGRGIKVCERWMVFENFLSDMGVRPAGTTLDRIDVNGDYEPGNCRWATRAQQTSNQRRTVYVPLNGEMLCFSEAARRLGMNVQTAGSRRKRGWSIERIFSLEQR